MPKFFIRREMRFTVYQSGNKYKNVENQVMNTFMFFQKNSPFFRYLISKVVGYKWEKIALLPNYLTVKVLEFEKNWQSFFRY